MGLYDTTLELTEAYLSNKSRRLQNSGTPQTRVDSGGNIGRSSFESQDIDRGDLRDVKEIRESGGVISQLVHAKALMQFGTGVEFQSDNDAVAEFLNDELNDIDNLVIDIGEDAIWYPYSIAEIVETNGGGFSHVELVEPWTMLPLENEFGDVVGWEQEIAGDYGTNVERFEPDELAQFILNKSSGRDKTGISEVIRAEDEINQYRNDMRAISNAVEIAGFRRHLWKVGREGGMVIDDNELRRVRNLVDSMKGDTQFIMGKDVDHELMESQDVSQFKTITEIDMRNLALALGVPIELASVISEGLGSGEQSGVRWQAFMLDTMASQRALADQFIQQIVRPILEQYSPFSRDENVELVFGDPVQDAQTKLTEIQAVGEDMTVNERRALFDKEPLDDEELGESFESPGQAGEEEGVGDEGVGSFFSDGRLLQVPDNATPISSPEECNGSVVEGPQGGMYCVPDGDGDGEDSGAGAGGGVPASVDLDREVDSMSLDEAGVFNGENKPDMRIAQLDDGSEVFVKEGVQDFEAEKALAGQAVYEQVGVPVPTHHYDGETTEMAKEAVDGTTLRDGVDVEVDRESVVDAFAASLITGDTDMHGGNMMIREDGVAVPIDIDGSGGPVRGPDDKRAKVEHHLGMLDVDVEYDEVWDRATEMASDVDPDGLPSTESDLGEIVNDNIRSNVEVMV